MGGGGKARKLLIWILGLGALAVAVLALSPMALEEYRIRTLLRAEAGSWRPIAEKLFASGRPRGLAASIEKVLLAAPEEIDAWEQRLHAEHPARARWVLPAYGRALRDGTRATRRKAINCLRRRPWRIPEVVPVLEGALRSDDPVLRWHGAYVLGEFGPLSSPATGALLGATTDAEENVRWAAVGALGAVLPATPETVAALERALGDPTERVSCRAADSLAELAPLDRAAAGAVPALIGTVEIGGPRRTHAAVALGRLGAEAAGAFRPLAKAMADGSDWSLCDVSPPVRGGELEDAFASAPDWERAAAEESGKRRARCLGAEALVRTAADAASLLPILEGFLDADECELQEIGILAMGGLGPEAAAATPRLVAALGEDCPPSIRRSISRDPTVRVGAVDALIRIGSASRAPLLAALRAGRPRVRRGALVALGSLEALPGEVVEAALALQEDPDRGVRLAAALLLHRADPARDIVPALLEAAESPAEDLLYTLHPAAWVDRVGPEGVVSLPRLLAELDRQGEAIPCIAPLLVGRIAEATGGARAALLHLPAALRSGGAQASGAAIRALADLPGCEAEVLPLLADLARTHEQGWVRSSALYALEKVLLERPAATGSARGALLPRILETLRIGPTLDVRLAALRSLAALGPEASSAVGELRAAAEAPEGALGWEEMLRWELLRTLAAIAPTDPQVLRRILELSARGEDGGSAVPLLRRLLEVDPVSDQTGWGEGVSAGSLPELEASLASADREVRVLGARLLARRGGSAERLLPALAEGILDVRHESVPIGSRAAGELLVSRIGVRFPIRQEACRLASELGPPVLELASAVEACLDLRDGVLRVLAAEALWKVRGDLRIDVLLPAARSARLPPIRYFAPQGPPEPAPEAVEALRVLAAMGSLAADALPGLEELLSAPRADPFRESVRATQEAILGAEARSATQR